MVRFNMDNPVSGQLLFLLMFFCHIGCSDELNEFSITVYNELEVPVLIYLDSIEYGNVTPGDNSRIDNVLAGRHTLQAEAAGYELTEMAINVEQDIEWTIRREED